MIKAVVLAGGSGTRLWPLSRVGDPKQFLDMNGEGTILQATMKSLKGLQVESSIIICNEEFKFLLQSSSV
jgi:mannose-1-phosphate guanylyltransferase